MVGNIAEIFPVIGAFKMTSFSSFENSIAKPFPNASLEKHAGSFSSWRLFNFPSYTGEISTYSSTLFFLNKLKNRIKLSLKKLYKYYITF
ncbi:Hypothetical protein MCYN_0737 [Mycoplasmopsis cynos C142]|uniref:Uncharacterized protein n=1 Tax=Mycoplasmopsis cynos (strain C142) TaxID=1246955 RepID=L0RV50_MYCC1|nr:Hypothetical protein MCYN_0737 [Mycoplasmopsis cynos C142]